MTSTDYTYIYKNKIFLRCKISSLSIGVYHTKAFYCLSYEKKRRVTMSFRQNTIKV